LARKSLGKGLRKIGTKTMKTVNKIGTKHTLAAIGHAAQDVGKVAGVLSVAAPEIGLPLMAAAAGVGGAANMALDAKSSVAAAKRGDMERSLSKAKSVKAGAISFR
jgi:hypothetical protein